MNNSSFYKDGKVLYCLFLLGLSLSFSSLYAGNPFRSRSAFSQQHQIKGVVTDGTNPLPGVSVTVKNRTGSVAITDYSGQYDIAASVSDTLVVSFLGFKTALIPVNGRTKVDVVLKFDTTTLKEVRINAGYYSVKESERTGSIARITSKDIENQPVTNVLATMQGRMAGVNIIQNTGLPGSGFEIEIRGQNSLRFNGNNPLYIIDGVPYSSQSIGSNMTSGNMPAENSPLNSINPSDVTSIEVLKDADATAIYGSRGANGVVLITTKKGKAGKTAFSAAYSNGIGQVAHFKDVLQTPQYLAMRREAFANDGVAEYPEYAYDINGMWDQNRNTNWQKELIGGTATYSNLQSSLTGGSEQTQFLLSGNYSRETTVFPGNFDYVKAGGHATINHESQDKRFRLNFSSAYTAQFNSLPAIDLTSTASMLVPNAPALYDDAGNLNWENNTFDNPMAPLQGKINGETYDLLANALLSYDIGAGFTAKSSFGYTNLNQKQLNLQPNTVVNPAYGSGSERSIVFTNSLNRSSWIIEPQLNWAHKMGKSKLDALVGTTFQQQKGDKLVNYGLGFANNSLMENPASAARTVVLSSNENLYRYEAFYARINFNYASKYLINLTGRRDGSSRFGPGKQFANFGAIGAAWVFSEEQWIKEIIPFFSFGKLRASYGTTGNDQIGDYQYLDTYSTSPAKYQGIAGLQPSRLFNPDFGWETNKKMEVALETGFLNDRIFSTIAWFQNRSSNQLVGLPLAGTTGFSSMQANLDAVVQNSGLEFSLRTVNIKNEAFSWSTNFNISSIKNELISFPGLETSTYSEQYVIGQPLNIIKVFHYTGLDPATGIYQFEDVNGDGAVNFGDDQKTIKNLNPKYYGGLQNQFHYRNVNLDFLFQFVKQENLNENFYNPMPGTMANQPTGVLSHWQNPGDLGPYQGYSDSNEDRSIANYQYSQSDAAISDASYIRLKNISLTYQLPQNWTKKVNCKIGIQGQNVLTITKYKGIDPEFKYSGYLPPLRVFTTSIQLTF
ncbi:MAG: SusC/RagA family TonB-linked outer membrane protein [Flavobacterium nitrogenifigens]|uniref:SusC/RagA family TonB-linked outer membrane protein n=1 Tax=Flavobacterium nitrogenifigens TaxID=1617283 RepID=UPI002807CD95|nr:SusC/RagA family TonB-linked outer membrane protein [Flavobacterium nitrogenifigens]MDQ8013382.1 SusC/RagA family TonB-linked outer membrane protein [Flavobacterium nitrogenifigens]